MKMSTTSCDALQYAISFSTSMDAAPRGQHRQGDMRSVEMAWRGGEGRQRDIIAQAVQQRSFLINDHRLLCDGPGIQTSSTSNDEWLMYTTPGSISRRPLLFRSTLSPLVAMASHALHRVTRLTRNDGFHDEGEQRINQKENYWNGESSAPPELVEIRRCEGPSRR